MTRDRSKGRYIQALPGTGRGESQPCSASSLAKAAEWGSVVFLLPRHSQRLLFFHWILASSRKLTPKHRKQQPQGTLKHDASTTNHLPSTASLIRELPTLSAPHPIALTSPPQALPRLFPPHNTPHHNRPRRSHTSRTLPSPPRPVIGTASS